MWPHALASNLLPLSHLQVALRQPGLLFKLLSPARLLTDSADWTMFLLTDTQFSRGATRANLMMEPQLQTPIAAPYHSHELISPGIPAGPVSCMSACQSGLVDPAAMKPALHQSSTQHKRHVLPATGGSMQASMAYSTQERQQARARDTQRALTWQAQGTGNSIGKALEASRMLVNHRSAIFGTCRAPCAA